MLTNEQITNISCMSIAELLELMEAVVTTIAIKMVHGEGEEPSPEPKEDNVWGLAIGS